MARFVLLLLGLVAVSSACTTSSGRLLGVDLGPNTEIYPFYSGGAVGIGFQHRFKRSADTPSKESFFSMLDTDDDGYVTVEEWHAEKGTVHDFTNMLDDLDVDGDERISLEEFRSVKDIQFRKQD